MYFGYATMWTFTFVPIAFAVVMGVGLALALVYVIGARRGKHAAHRYARACLVVLLVGFGADIAYAAISGQWSAFVGVYGWAPVVEMGVLALMFIGGMWMMAASYLREQRRGPNSSQGSEGSNA